MNIGDKVVLKKGTQVGMGQLKADIDSIIIRTDKDEKGHSIYCVEYTYKNDTKRTWIRG